jgi:hypothetical protein
MSAIWRGRHPEDGSELRVVDGPPEGGPVAPPGEFGDCGFARQLASPVSVGDVVGDPAEVPMRIGLSHLRLTGGLRLHAC